MNQSILFITNYYHKSCNTLWSIKYGATSHSTWCCTSREQKDGFCLKENLNIRQESGWLETDGKEGGRETIHVTVTGRPLYTECLTVILLLVFGGLFRLGLFERDEEYVLKYKWIWGQNTEVPLQILAGRRKEGRKMLFRKLDKCMTGAGTDKRHGDRADLPQLGREAVKGLGSKARPLCWKGAGESWTEGCQSRAVEGRLRNSVLQSLHQGPGKTCCDAQGKELLALSWGPGLEMLFLRKDLQPQRLGCVWWGVC